MTEAIAAQLAAATWRKSTRSAGGNECVEVAELAQVAAVRDSKDTTRAPIVISRPAFMEWVEHIRTT